MGKIWGFSVIFLLAAISRCSAQRFAISRDPRDGHNFGAGADRSEFVSSVFVQGPSLQVQGPAAGQGGETTVRRMRMSESCLACICAASTDCNLTKGCVAGGEYCGPFLLSKPYWLDAGSPVILGDSAERPEAFQDCALDPICSAQTVRKYMTRFQKDCTGDGFVGCDDLALIHLLGPFGSECGNPSALRSGYFQKFATCWNSVLRLSPTAPFPEVGLGEEQGQRLT